MELVGLHGPWDWGVLFTNWWSYGCKNITELRFQDFCAVLKLQSLKKTEFTVKEIITTINLS